jgi:carbon storage regulator
MLVLSRKKAEAICIGGQIKITVLEVAGNSVRIGIEAPKSVTVLRHELVETPSRELAVSNYCNRPHCSRPL